MVIALCLYIILAPFWPRVSYELQKEPPLAQADTPPPEENTLVIPRIKLQQSVHEGEDSSTLQEGVWRRPLASSPPNGGNTVFTGHRFTYGGPAVFYHLDQVRVEDEVVVFWNKKKYEYIVKRIIEVPPSAIEIEDQTDDSMLTIYTCTPLITATHRLVIQAKLVESDI